jgi:membrane protease YdiL (CAAX protease family)
METTEKTTRFGNLEILALIWIIAALAVLYPVTALLEGAFPIFTLLLLIVPLVVLIRRKDAARIGLRVVPLRSLIKYSSINLVGSLALMVIFEPWSHTYQILLHKAISSSHPDTTFGWLLRYPGLLGWIGLAMFAGLVSLFAEELFFRGWLLRMFQTRMGPWKAITLQALLFTLPQCLAASLLPTLQGILYAVIYSFVVIGLLGGWSANKTQSIWPSLISATVYNLVMVMATY